MIDRKFLWKSDFTKWEHDYNTTEDFPLQTYYEINYFRFENITQYLNKHWNHRKVQHILQIKDALIILKYANENSSNKKSITLPVHWSLGEHYTLLLNC